MKRNFQFQLRLLERTTKTTTSLYVWLQDQKHPETQQQFENMVQELNYITANMLKKQKNFRKQEQNMDVDSTRKASKNIFKNSSQLIISHSDYIKASASSSYATIHKK